MSQSRELMQQNKAWAQQTAVIAAAQEVKQHQ